MSKINRKHIVNRTEFVVEVDKKEDADKIQSNFSRVFNSRLIRIMDNVLSEFSNEKENLLLEYLEIDIGIIDNRFFDKQVEEQFEAKLRKQLKDIIKLEQVRYKDKTVKLQKIDVAKSDLELILFFLETGRLPSSHPTTGTSIDAILQNLIAEKSPRLLKAIETVSKKPNVLKRINHQFSKDTVNKLIKFVVPRSYSYIGKETRALERQFNKAAPVAGLSPSKFRKILRESVLQYLFKERKGSFFKKTFLKSLDKQIEIRTGIEKELLLKGTSETEAIKDNKQLEDFAKAEAEKMNRIVAAIMDTTGKIPKNKAFIIELIKILQASGLKLKSLLQEKKADWSVVVSRLKVLLPDEELGVIAEFIEFIAEIGPKAKQAKMLETLLPILGKDKDEIEKIKQEKIKSKRPDSPENAEPPSENPEAIRQQDLDILFHLFKEVEMPWWAPESIDSFSVILSRVIQQSPEALRKVWKTAHKQATSRKKIEVIQFFQKELNNTTIGDFIEVLEPDYIGFILTQALALEQITEVSDPWIPIFTYLSEKGDRAFDLPSFVKKTIKVVSKQIDRPVKELIKEILKKINVAIGQGQPRFIPLESILTSVLVSPPAKETDSQNVQPGTNGATPLENSTTKEEDSQQQPSKGEESAQDSQQPSEGKEKEQSTYDILLSKSFKTPQELSIEEVLQVMEYFLDIGALPPAIASFTAQQLEKLFEIAITEKPLSARDILIRQLARKEVRTTVAKTFTSPILLRLLARIQPVNKSFYEYAQVILKVSSQIKNRKITPSIIEFLLFYAISSKTAFEVGKAHRIMLKHVAREQSILLKEIAEQLNTAFKKVMGKTDPPTTTKAKIKKPENLTESLQQLTEVLILEYERKPQRKFKPRTVEDEANAQAENAKKGEPIYIENAGLILLYPLMRIAFKMLGYTTPLKNFKDKASAFRAIHFLQYTVARQNKGVPEYMLALNKLLCGIPFSVAIDNDIVLTDKEKEMGDELIRQLIMQWPMVKNSSVEGFRNSFLVRNGSLVLEGKVWVLNVNEAGYDMVMQSYPWGLNLIKFQWMNDYSLRAEWGSTLY